MPDRTNRPDTRKEDAEALVYIGILAISFGLLSIVEGAFSPHELIKSWFWIGPDDRKSNLVAGLFSVILGLSAFPISQMTRRNDKWAWIGGSGILIALVLIHRPSISVWANSFCLFILYRERSKIWLENRFWLSALQLGLVLFVATFTSYQMMFHQWHPGIAAAACAVLVGFFDVFAGSLCVREKHRLLSSLILLFILLYSSLAVDRSVERPEGNEYSALYLFWLISGGVVAVAFYYFRRPPSLPEPPGIFPSTRSQKLGYYLSRFLGGP